MIFCRKTRDCFPIFQSAYSSLQNQSYVLRRDFLHGTNLPDDYEADLESVWANFSEKTQFLMLNDDEKENVFLDSGEFVVGDDFSLSAIDRDRNKYFHRKFASELEEQMENLVSSATRTLQNHLGFGQRLTFNRPEFIFVLERTSLDSLRNRTFSLVGKNRIQIPVNFLFNDTNFDSFRVRLSKNRRRFSFISKFPIDFYRSFESVRIIEDFIENGAFSNDFTFVSRKRRPRNRGRK